VQFRVRFAFQGDLFRGCAGDRGVSAMALSQKIEQLGLLGFRDGGVLILNCQTRLTQLGEQPVGGNTDDLSELFYRNF